MLIPIAEPSVSAATPGLPMTPAIQSLQTTLRLPHFERKVIEALRLVSTLENASANLDEEWFAQVVRGFINLTLEAAEGAGQATRETFFATVVPGLLAEGQPPSVLIRSSTTFLSLLGSQLIVEVEGVHQKDAAVWFASFAGSYVDDLYRACMAEEPS